MRRAALILLTILTIIPTALIAGNNHDLPAGYFPSLEEGVVQVEVLGAESRDFLAQYSGDTLFIPLLPICDFLRIPAGAHNDGELLRGSFPRDRQFEFDRSSGRAVCGAMTIDFGAPDIREVKGEIYIRHDLFFKLLGLSANFDVGKLTLVIAADHRLPILELERNRNRYAMLDRDGEKVSGVPAPAVERDLLGSPIFDWTIANSYNDGATSTDATLTLGCNLLFGELNLELNGGGSVADTSRFRVTPSNWSWKLYTPELPALQQVTVGGINIIQRSAYGIGLTNVPLMRRRSIGEHDIHGQTHPGWAVEVYDGTKLVDVTRADSSGEYTLQMPIGYGVVDRTLRYVGPYGESITERRVLQLNPQMIPAGEVRYRLIGGIDKPNQNGMIVGDGEIGIGLTDRITLGAQSFVRPTPLGMFATDSLSPSLFGTIWIGEASSMALRYETFEKRASGSWYTLFNNNATLRVAVDSLEPRQWNGVASIEGALPVGNFSFGGRGSVANDSLGLVMRIVPEISGYIAGVNFIASTTLERTAAGLANSVSSLRLAMTPLQGTLLAVNANYDHRSRSFTDLDLSLYARLGNCLGLSFGASASRFDWGSASLRGGIELHLNAARIFSIADREAGRTTLSTYARGSAMISTAGVTTSPDFTVGKSAVIVRAFRDENNNGLRDDGEEYLDPPRTDLSIDGLGMNAADGMYTSLVPNTEWLLDIDRWDYADRGLYPGRTRYRIFLIPNSVATIEIPYQHGFDATGRVTGKGSGENGGERTYGLRVQIESESNGSVYDAEVFSDGSVDIPGVSAGAYRLVIDADQLASRGLVVAAPTDRFFLDERNHHIPAIELAPAK